MSPPTGGGEGGPAGGLEDIAGAVPNGASGAVVPTLAPGATPPLMGEGSVVDVDDDDEQPWTPTRAVDALLALEREGLRFHQMRERASAMLAAPDVHVPSFAAESLRLLAARRHRNRQNNQNNQTESPGDAATDPLAHLIMECVPKASAAIRERHDFPMMDQVSSRERFANSADRSSGAELIRDSLRSSNDQNDPASMEPRALLRVAETYGLDLADLCAEEDGNEMNDDVATTLEAYVRSLIFEEGRHAPGINLALWFSLTSFATDETVTALTRASQFGLASDLAACVDGVALKSRCVDACLETNDHAGLRAANAAVDRFELQATYPLVRQKYFESTIGRMVEKGQSEAALRHAGDDVALQMSVVQALVEAGDAVTATEFAGRLGVDVNRAMGPMCTDEDLLKAAAERREAHVQLPTRITDNGGVVWVDDEEGLKAACDALLAADIVGLDTEWAADLEQERQKADENRQRKGTRWARKRWRDQKKLAKQLAAEAEAEAEAAALDAVDALAHGPEGGTSDDSDTDGDGDDRTLLDEDALDAAERRAASVVALLQIATSDAVFLVDLPALLRRCPDAIAPTLGRVLSDARVLKTGFGVAEDLRRLAKLHPPAFGVEKNGGPSGGVGPVVDLQHVWAAGTRIAREEASNGGQAKRGRRARAAAAAATGGDRSPPRRLAGPWSLKEHYQRKHLVGLSHLTAAVLGKPLDKATRMSDWSKRPLTPRQVTYAALDAWVLVEVMRTLRLNYAEELERIAGGLTQTRE